MVVNSKIRKWGNSLGIRIHKVIAEQINLKDGSVVEIQVSGNKLIITPTAPVYTLDSLLAGVNENNLPGEVDTGPAAGAEAW